MSGNQFINSALLKFCLAADDGPRQQESQNQEDGSAENQQFRQRATTEDLQWLRQAMEAMEMPDRAVKRCLTRITDWVLPCLGQMPVPTTSTTANRNSMTTATAATAAAGDGAATTSTTAATTTVSSSSSNNNNNNSSSNNASGGGGGSLLVIPQPEQNQQEQQQSQQIQQEKPYYQERSFSQVTLDDLPDVTDEILDAAEELRDLSEDMNYAKEFMLMKGAQFFLDILKMSFVASDKFQRELIRVGVQQRQQQEQQQQQQSAADSAEANLTIDEENRLQDLQQKQKSWMTLRALLISILGSAAANFSDFQTELCKLDWARRVFVPRLSSIAAHQLPNLVAVGTGVAFIPRLTVQECKEHAQLLLAVANIVRAHDGALQQFIESDGMFHLANAVQFLSKFTNEKFSGDFFVEKSVFYFDDGGEVVLTPIERKVIDVLINAKRRAFNLARFLVEEHGVTSQRVLRAAIDTVETTSKFMMRKKQHSDQQQQQRVEEIENDDGAYDRCVENSCVAAFNASQCLCFAIVRTLSSKNSNNNQQNNEDAAQQTTENENSLDHHMPQWGQHLIAKFTGGANSSEGNNWWSNFKQFSSIDVPMTAGEQQQQQQPQQEAGGGAASSSSSARNQNGQEEATLLQEGPFGHHELSLGMIQLLRQLGKLKEFDAVAFSMFQ